MRFVKAIWKLLVGIKDALVLLFMLMFFGLLYAALSARPAPIGDGVLAMDLDGVLVEQPSGPIRFRRLPAPATSPANIELKDLVAALDAAKDDDRVKAIALDLDGFLGGGQTALAALGEKLDEVKKSGKPVVAFATGYTDDRYQLAAHASEVWLPPMGAVAVAGPGGNNLYFKGLLDKLGVTANIYRVGTYKSAVEPYIRNDMSPEARENAQALGDALLETWREDVARGRPAAMPGSIACWPIRSACPRPPTATSPRRRSTSSWSTRSASGAPIEARLAELGGKDEDSAARLSSGSSLPPMRTRRSTHDEGPIGVVTIAGEIVDGKAGPGRAGGETIVAADREGPGQGRI